MNNKIIVFILILGIIYRLFLTSGGNFLFNMDNARDMVDVREMVVLGKLRLTGPTSAIEGLYNGPAWYYLLVIPFIISGGDPYASILMEIILWAIGGFFLLKLVKIWSNWLIIPIGAIWVSSNYIVLANVYAFNPNPVVLLTPLFIYSLVLYLENKKAIYIILTWFLAGLFFNFEMNFGVFTPIIILASVIFTKNVKLLKQKWFFVGIALFVFTLLPQALFDFRHDFLMSKAVLRHLSENSGANLNILGRFQTIPASFFDTYSATLMNHKSLAASLLLISAIGLIGFLKKEKKKALVLVSLMIIAIPFLGYLILPVTVNPWHLGAEMAASLILIAYILKERIFIPISILIIWFSVSSIGSYIINDFGKPNLDPSLYKNEIAAIDYVYQSAKGRNFKVYTFMPSVYDYPYQYLFWWYGQKKYKYIPAEYAYAPNKPSYISNKDKFAGSKDNYQGLVFLIKEPNRGYNWKSGWEASYQSMELLSSEKLGSIEIEIRRE
ncbi:MAG: hypothetical protein ABIC96_04540 [Patescibacteria group bacterium]